MKKIAIKVYNKAQFDALMKHYESKGWKPYSGCSFVIVSNWAEGYESFPCNIEYSDNCKFANFTERYEILCFETFSQLTGVEAVKEIRLDNYGVTVKDNMVYFDRPTDKLGSHCIADIHAAFTELKGE